MEKRRKQERGKQRKQEIEIGKRKQEKETGNRKRGGRKKERRCFTSQGSSGKEHRESQGGSKRSSLDSAWRGKNDLRGKKGIRDNITDS